MFSLQIVKRYDIILIQEIRDKSETSIDILVDAVNAHIGSVLNFSCRTHLNSLTLTSLRLLIIVSYTNTLTYLLTSKFQFSSVPSSNMSLAYR